MFMTKGHKRDVSLRRAFLFGIVINLLILALMLVISSAIVSTMSDPISAVGMGSVCALYLTALISGFITAKYKGEGGMLATLFSSLFFALTLLTVGLLSSGGSNIPLSMINCPVYVIISLIGGVLARKRSRKKRHG